MEFKDDKKRSVDTPRVRESSAAADHTTGQTMGDVSSIGDKARSDISQAAETARAEARRIAHQQKEAGAERLGEVAGAFHGAARSLETGMPQMASYVHDAAARLEDAANTLRRRNVDDLIGEINRFARNQPALFFGGAMLAGFALARFLKTSAPDGSAAPSTSSAARGPGSPVSSTASAEGHQPGAQR